MMVRMDSARLQGSEGSAPIGRDMQGDSKNVNPLSIVRIDSNLAKVERTRTKVIHLGPGCTCIGGAEDTACCLVTARLSLLSMQLANVREVSLHDGVDQPWIPTIDRQPTPALIAFLETQAELVPAGAAISGFVDSRIRAELDLRIAAGEAIPPA